eukprot:CAMPEP_0172681706 /NCGR_PEP_ID=MMETSP1074-20121228/17652_1 /TAXON_ID=2916 /ORGANISM="Ceratium fusus, Strain PA161109" /LENGTH=91 /DNA_ID=CAMNT_0013500257 /DNA_START=192 /DNA_END=464 /DNA_ORIENTATION=-
MSRLCLTRQALACSSVSFWVVLKTSPAGMPAPASQETLGSMMSRKGDLEQAPHLESTSLHQTFGEGAAIPPGQMFCSQGTTHDPEPPPSQG